MDLASILGSFSLWSEEIILSFGYLGVFIVSIISTATIFLPLPAFVFVVLGGHFLNPWLVSIVAAAGMAIGEITGYIIGKGGNKAIKKKNKKWLKKGEEWFKKGRGFVFIFIFAATPLPDDITGILGGMFNYNVWRFLFASFLGKLVMNLALALAGFYGIGWLMSIFGVTF